MVKKVWLTPIIILALLFAAWALRWDYTATKTYDSGVVKWKIDRWTGQAWVELNIAKDWTIKDKPALPLLADDPWQKRQNVETAWKCAVGLSIFWLLYTIRIGPWIKHRSVTANLKCPKADGIA